MSLHLSLTGEPREALLTVLERAELARLHRAVFDGDGNLMWPGGAAKLLSEHIATLSAPDFPATPESEELLAALVSMRAWLVRWFAAVAPERQRDFRAALRNASTLSGTSSSDGAQDGSSSGHCTDTK